MQFLLVGDIVLFRSVHLMTAGRAWWSGMAPENTHPLCRATYSQTRPTVFAHIYVKNAPDSFLHVGFGTITGDHS